MKLIRLYMSSFHSTEYRLEKQSLAAEFSRQLGGDGMVDCRGLCKNCVYKTPNPHAGNLISATCTRRPEVELLPPTR